MQIRLRNEPVSADRQALTDILVSTGMFYDFEIEVALELLDDRIEKGPASEYIFMFADAGDRAAGYICYGPITMAEGRFDLYWIAVKADMQGRGVGSLLLSGAERHMAESFGCKHIYVETASREQYRPTREFYRKNGYREAARVPKFYADDDDKIIFMKSL
ncbi:MAG: GNAT family N-acetyltransferase [Nitrospiraceae bacterium]|nr:GNAT family N-acetyltransferase [Nitrospiraceae bacterium]